MKKNTRGQFQNSCSEITVYSYYLCLTVGNCVNVDECNGIADCGDNSQCQDLTPGFECRCNEGYKKSEDGSTCVGMLIALLY